MKMDIGHNSTTKNSFSQKWPSKLLFCRKGSNVPKTYSTQRDTT